MRIHCTVSGSYEWVEVPSGTSVTESDFASGKAKEAADGTVLIRIPISHDEARPHDFSFPEDQVAENIANRVKTSSIHPAHRDAIVIQMTEAAFGQHFDRRIHLETLTVVDEGPAPDLLREKLVAHRLQQEQIDGEVAIYAKARQGEDMGRFLATYFGADYVSPT